MNNKINGWQGYLVLSLFQLTFAFLMIFDKSGLSLEIRTIGASVFSFLFGLAFTFSIILYRKSMGKSIILRDVFTIKKGNHYSSPFRFLIFKPKNIRVTWFFSGEVKQSSSFTNKLCGFGFFPHHLRNSWRIGYEVIDGIMFYSLYLHIDGKRRIIILPGIYGDHGELDIKFNGTYLEIFYKKSSILLVSLKDRGYGYFLKPYHGGKEVNQSKYSVHVTIENRD